MFFCLSSYLASPRRVSPTDLICFDTFFCLATFIGGSYAERADSARGFFKKMSGLSRIVEEEREVRRKENNARVTKKTEINILEQILSHFSTF